MDTLVTIATLNPTYEDRQRDVPLSLDTFGSLRTRSAQTASFQAGQVDVGTLPVLVFPADMTSTWRYLTNAGTVTLFIGPDASVTAEGGFPIPPGDDLVIPWTAATYGVVGMGSTIAGILTST